MQFNNVIASSNLASQRTNEFSFTMSYDDYIVVPKSVSVSKASIPNTMLSFRKNQLNIFIQFLGATYSFPIQNGYYDNISEFIPMLNLAIQEQVSTEFTFSYSTAHEALKLTNTSNHAFVVLPYTYDRTSVVKRLGFIETVGYASFSEGSNQVVYATGLLRLARTSGFYLVSNIINSNSYTCAPNNNNNVIDYFPIQLSVLAYGDSIVINNSNSTFNVVNLPQRETYNASSSFFIQLLDDEMQTIDDDDKGQNCIIFLQLDYD